MVCQVYAPIDRPRSLYIFCCNRRQCSLKSEGWLAIRNQQLCAAPPPPPDLKSRIPPQQPPSAGVFSNWSFLQEPDAAKAGSVEIDDLERMLMQRDESVVMQKAGFAIVASATPSTATVDTPPDAPGIAGQEWRPCRRMVDLEDSWFGKGHPLSRRGGGLKAKGGDNGDDDDDDDDEDEDDNEDVDNAEEEEEESFSRTAASDTHVRQLLEGYLKDDPDDELAALLETRSGRGQSRPGDGLKGSHTRERKNKEEGQAGWLRRLSRSSPRAKAELYFQRRIAAEPRQVIRYAYGGEPLWCTYPPPESPEHRLLCRCGAARRFELQLMPALLALNMAARSAATSTNLGATEDDDRSAVGIDREGQELLQVHSQVCQVGGDQSSCRGVHSTPALALAPTAAADDDPNHTTHELTSGPIIDDNEHDADDDDDDNAAAVSCEYTKPSASQISDLMRRLGDGLDFGVLAVYVCPDSCSLESEELCIVQSPADIA